MSEASESPKSGFDLIEYPCDYAFKAVCKIEPGATVPASEVVRELVLAHTVASSILDVKAKASRAGKFESVTVTVRLTTVSQLKAIYTALSDSPLVVMTL